MCRPAAGWWSSGAVPGAGNTLCSLGLRYLHTVRAGPGVATARVRGRSGQVALHGYGKGNRLLVLAVAGTPGAGEPARGVE